MKQDAADTVSVAALWCRRLGLASIGLVAGAVAASQAGWVRPAAAVLILQGGAACAALAVGAALLTALVVWQTGKPGLGLATVGLMLAVVAVAGPAWFAVQAADMPPVHDVSTAPADPPPLASDPATPADPKLPVQTAPGPPPLALAVDPMRAYTAALKLAKARRWSLVEMMPPRGSLAGRIAGTAKTPIMGFPCDVAIRITSAGTKRSRIDMRSSTRWSGGDGGDDAARIDAFLAGLAKALRQ